MCGLIGFVSYKEEEGLISQLTNSLSHRGPDESSYSIIKVDNYFIHFGSTRLSVVGEDVGKMPMSDENNNQLIYNGELYDLQKIKKQLNLTKKTSSDTYHLFEFIKKYEEKKLAELNGMFAFSFYNATDHSILLGRDKLGIKPLHYMETNDYPLVFSSEIKPLISYNFSNKLIKQSNMESFLLFGGINKFSNLIDDIKTIEPGSYLKWKISGSNKSSYFSPKKKYEDSDLKLENLLATVIEDQLEADVNVDLLLSGGIDSSIITYITKKILNKNVKAYSLSFEKNEFDESIKAMEISKELGIQHEIIKYKKESNHETIDELMKILPEPIGDPSIIPTYYLNKFVSKQTKAVLTGDGADELFSGYDWYRALIISPYLPPRYKKLIFLYSTIYKKVMGEKNINLKDKYELFFSGQGKNTPVKILNWQNTFKLNNIKKEEDIFNSYIDKLDLSSSKNKFDLTQLIDLNTYIYTNILKKSDTASMLNGLEVRPVFLDDRILNYSLSVNQKKNVSIFKSKKELRNIVSKFSKLSNQQKQGFSHDFGEWINNTGAPYLNKQRNNSEIINTYLNTIQNKSSHNTIDERNIWKLYSLFKWIEVNGLDVVK